MAGTFVRWACVVGAAVAAGVLSAAPAEPTKEAKEAKENSNALVKQYKGKLEVTASTFYNGWGPEKLVDGDLETSWFSASGDSAAKGTKPWVEVEFPEDVTVSRVTIKGNREPNWFDGFTVLAGRVELFDKNGKRLYDAEAEVEKGKRDFDFKPKQALNKVRKVRFTSLGDEGDKNGYDDCAIGEVQVD